MAEKITDALVLTQNGNWDAVAAFVAVDELGSCKAAAELLGRTEHGVRELVKKLARHLRVEDVVRPDETGVLRASGQIARDVRAQARLCINEYAAVARYGDDNVRIRYLPQHSFFMAAVEAQTERFMDLHPKALGEEDRSVDRFEDEVIPAVAGGNVDLVIGMPPRKGTMSIRKLTSHYLYSSRQEAMVPYDDPRQEMTLRQLIEERRMLVPPIHTRSRTRLEQMIASDLPDAPPAAQRVRREAFGTKVLIQYGMNGLGTVVVPNDIAYVFHAGHDYGGPQAEKFRWIPIRRENGEFIHQSVWATVRTKRDRRSPHVDTLVEEIRNQVKLLDLETRTPEQVQKLLAKGPSPD
jgi:DNA-binding transcriptional LysR family regulator